MNIYNINIGHIIDPEVGLKLCKHFRLDHIIRRIENNLNDYEPFEFDGCSCLPDELLGLFTSCKWQDITYLCCLPHDLEYAYGDSDDDEGKIFADISFKYNLLFKAHMKNWLAKVFLAAVSIGGAEELGLSFSWGFARKKKVNKNTNIDKKIHKGLEKAVYCTNCSEVFTSRYELKDTCCPKCGKYKCIYVGKKKNKQ